MIISDVLEPNAKFGACFRMSAKWAACQLSGMVVSTQLPENAWHDHKMWKGKFSASLNIQHEMAGETLHDAKWHSTLVKQKAFLKGQKKDDDPEQFGLKVLQGWCDRITRRTGHPAIHVVLCKEMNRVTPVQKRAITHGTAAFIFDFYSTRGQRGGHAVAVHANKVFDSANAIVDVQDAGFDGAVNYIKMVHVPLNNDIYGYFLERK